MCRLMVTINLHACEATTQETVGRGSNIDLHVCGASVCVEEPPSVCAHLSRREPHDVRQACCATPSQRIGTPTASLSHQAMTSVVPRHVPWDHRAFGC